jgi:hypothetical protein
MKQLLFKLFFTPFVAYFLMMFTVAALGSIYDTNWLKEHLNGSGLYVWYGWLALLIIITVAHHFLQKPNNE